MGNYHILKEYANGVMDSKGKFFPFKSTSYASQTTMLASKSNIRYYIKTVQVTGFNSGDKAEDSVTVSGVIDTQTKYLAKIKISASTAATAGINVQSVLEVHCLLDMSTAVSLASTATGFQCNVIYAEIDELEGEYDG